MQELSGITPRWLLFRSLFPFKNSKILSKISFSNFLEHIDNSETRRYFLTNYLLFFLLTARKLAFFQSPGKMPDFRQYQKE